MESLKKIKMIITLDNIKQLQSYKSIITKSKLMGGNSTPTYYLENDLHIALSNGDVIHIPKGFIWDLSSVPRFLWGILPPDGDFELATIIHDYLYKNLLYTRKFADQEMLKWSIVVSGTKTKISARNIDNYTRYYGVRIGGWYKWNKNKKQQRHEKN